MNERDYNLIEYCSIVAGLCLIGEYLLMCAIFDLAYDNPSSMIFLVIIGIITIFFSTIAHFKKILYLQEMKGYVKKPKDWNK